MSRKKVAPFETFPMTLNIFEPVYLPNWCVRFMKAVDLTSWQYYVFPIIISLKAYSFVLVLNSFAFKISSALIQLFYHNSFFMIQKYLAPCPMKVFPIRKKECFLFSAPVSVYLQIISEKEPPGVLSLWKIGHNVLFT